MTYEYTCATCDHNWEASHGMSEPPVKTCPICGNDTAKRLISSGTTFTLMGGGWYADGYGARKVTADAK